MRTYARGAAVTAAAMGVSLAFQALCGEVQAAPSMDELFNQLKSQYAGQLAPYYQQGVTDSDLKNFLSDLISAMQSRSDLSTGNFDNVLKDEGFKVIGNYPKLQELLINALVSKGSGEVKQLLMPVRNVLYSFFFPGNGGQSGSPSGSQPGTSGGGGGGGGGGGAPQPPANQPQPPRPPGVQPPAGGTGVTLEPTAPAKTVTDPTGTLLSKVELTEGDFAKVNGMSNLPEIVVQVPAPKDQTVLGGQVTFPLSALQKVRQTSPTVHFTVNTASGALSVPAKVLAPEALAKSLHFAGAVDPAQVQVTLTVSELNGARGEDLGRAVRSQGFEPAAGWLNFRVEISVGGTTTELRDFGGQYVIHRIPLRSNTGFQGYAGVMIRDQGGRVELVPVPTVIKDGTAALLVPHNSLYTVVRVDRHFGDVPGNYWGATAVLGLADRLIVSGYPDGLFHPDNPMTRAEFVTTLVRGLGLEPVPAGGFTDVSAGAWYASSVGAAVQAGLVHGYPDGTFHPDGRISREEAAQLLYNAATFLNVQGASNARAAGAAAGTFSDGHAINPVFVRAVGTMADQGLIRGYPDGTFRPQDTVTRAEMAAMMTKLLQLAKLMN
ncbi:MAG: S-layer homology domain-containing protein [Kyrpidia sp.]|nr:S-layer homology domain-containing protein [Kyrpidia sp.]